MSLTGSLSIRNPDPEHEQELNPRNRPISFVLLLFNAFSVTMQEALPQVGGKHHIHCERLVGKQEVIRFLPVFPSTGNCI